MNEKRIEYGVIAFALIGLLGLYLMAYSTAPVHIQISDMPANVGRYVYIEGVVHGVKKFDWGAALITVRDMEDPSITARAFIEECVSNFSFGDVIRVHGTVKESKGSLEVYTLSDKSIVLLNKSGASNFMWLQDLAQNPAKYTGMVISTAGTVKKIYSFSFWLEDGDYSIYVKTEIPVSELGFEAGIRIPITGQVLFDQEGFQYYMLIPEEEGWE